MAKSLVIYYSRKGENYFGGSIRKIVKGNTEVIAEYIAEATGAALFEADTVQPYSADYTTCTEEAKVELRKGSRPELKSYPEDGDYEYIFVGGPCWWGTYPMAVFSALDKLDLNGKTLIPFMTHEGSGMGSSERDLKRLYPMAKVKSGLAIRGSSVQGAKAQVESWAKRSINGE